MEEEYLRNGNPREEAGSSGFSGDTMLRLNFHCLNNQARRNNDEREICERENVGVRRVKKDQSFQSEFNF